MPGSGSRSHPFDQVLALNEHVGKQRGERRKKKVRKKKTRPPCSASGSALSCERTGPREDERKKKEKKGKGIPLRKTPRKFPSPLR